MGQDSIDLIEAMRSAAEKARPITGRGIGYKLFTLGLIPSMTRQDMARVYRLLRIAREQGTIPWEWIVDESRSPERVPTWSDPEAYARCVARSYRRDFWSQQPVRVEVWSEKGTVRGVLAPVLDDYGVTFRVMHGFGSATVVHDVAQDYDGRTLIALYVALQGLTGFVLQWAGPSARLPTLLAMELVTCAVMVIAYRALVRLVERRGASELAFDASTAFASRGALFGAALFCAVYAVLWASGSAHYLGFDGLGGVLFAFGISIAAAFGEEIIVRGGIFRVIEEGFGTLVAVIFSASLFGALHAVNNGATLVSTVSIGLEAGVLLGLAYTATRSLWFPIGIHFGWNFAQYLLPRSTGENGPGIWLVTGGSSPYMGLVTYIAPYVFIAVTAYFIVRNIRRPGAMA